MNDDFFLNEMEVEASIQKIMGYVEEQNKLITDFSSIIFQDLKNCYHTDLNSNIEGKGSILISKLNNTYKEQIDNCMLLKADRNALLETKRINIQNMENSESELI